jgi:putative Ca2+/H+ antiporter (TMEM165/GDT1 family)
MNSDLSFWQVAFLWCGGVIGAVLGMVLASVGAVESGESIQKKDALQLERVSLCGVIANGLT